MPGPIFLDGGRVTLCPAIEDDLSFLLEHWNNPAVRAMRTDARPTGPEDARRYLGGTLGRNDDSVGLLACTKGDPVGYVMLVRERPNDDTFGRVELAYWVAPEYWGEGYATEAAGLLLDHGFSGLRLHKVTAKAFEFNDRSRRVLEKLGFAKEGVFREEAFVDGGWHDFYRYGLLEDEWRAVCEGGDGGDEGNRGEGD